MKFSFYAWVFLFIIISFGFSTRMQAQVLVADINQTNQGSAPKYLISNDNYFTFFARGDQGMALYLLEIGEEEPELIYNVSDAGLGESIWDAQLIDDDLYFVTNVGSLLSYHKTNLNNKSTSIFFEIESTGIGSSLLNNFIKLGDQIIFFNRPINQQYQFWKTDGTRSGTTVIGNVSGSFPSNLKVYNDELYFTFRSDENKGELWKTDGNSFELIVDTDPTNNRINFGTFRMEVFNDKLYFDAFSSTKGYEVWFTEGTPSSTRIFKDFAEGEANGSFLKGVIGDRLFLSAFDPIVGNELHVSDGTLQGTQVYVDTEPGLGDANIDFLLGNNDIQFFTRYTNDYGSELWRTDGTSNGTFLLKDINPGVESAIESAFNFKLLGEILYFTANDGQNGKELWTTDGTSAGTNLLMDIYPGRDDSEINELLSFNNEIYFNADSPDYGEELWKSSPSNNVTEILKDLNTNSSASSFPSRFQEINDTLYFQAATGCTGFELFKTDSRSNSTGLVKDVLPGKESSNISGLVGFQNHIYFAGDGQTIFNRGLWKSDGTSSGTNFSNSIEGGLTGFSGFGTPAVLNNQIIFKGFVREKGQCILSSNGVSDSLKILKIINPSSGFTAGDNVFTALNDSILLFEDRDTSHGVELWRTNGTEQGTYMVKDIRTILEPNNTITDHIGKIHIFNELAYFRANDGLTGERLWRSDGTEEGTFPISESDMGRPSEVLQINNEIYFSTNNATEKIYKTDGTLAGTIIAPYNDANPGFSSISMLQEFKGHIYFAGITNLGTEIWRYNPNNQSLKLVKDIYPGENGQIRNLSVAGEIMIFAADDGIHGSELWKSDGTRVGTEMVADMVPGPSGSSPSNFYHYKNFIYFRGKTGDEIGTELYKYSPLDKDNDGYLPPEDIDDNDPLVNVSEPNDPWSPNTYCTHPDSTTNTIDIDWINEVLVSPNPAKHFIQIDLPGFTNYLVRVFDILGRPVKNLRPINGKVSFEVNSLLPGNYLIQVQNLSNGSAGIWKIMIQ